MTCFLFLFAQFYGTKANIFKVRSFAFFSLPSSVWILTLFRVDLHIFSSYISFSPLYEHSDAISFFSLSPSLEMCIHSIQYIRSEEYSGGNIMIIWSKMRRWTPMHPQNKYGAIEREQQQWKRDENVKHLVTRFACLLKSIDVFCKSLQ